MWSICVLSMYNFNFRREGIFSITPFAVKADGNCLFNALSLAYFGSENYGYELRVRCCRLMYEDPDIFSHSNLSAVYGRDLSSDEFGIIIQSSLDLKGKPLSEAVQDRAKLMLNHSRYASVLEVVASGIVLNVNINLIYPCSETPYTRKELFSGKLICAINNGDCESITLSWTHTTDSNTQGCWAPNHFVPCLVNSKVLFLIVNFNGHWVLKSNTYLQ